MFASRLGSLSTVFTWLRSRACAGMQGLGVLALVVVTPCGFAAHVAPEEAVLSSPRNRCGRSFKKKSFFFFLYALETSKIRRKLRNLLRPWGPCPYHLPPRNQSPWTPPSRATLVPPSKKTSFFFLSCDPTTYPPRHRSPWTPPPEPLYPPHPTGYPSKKIIFLLRVKNMTQVAKFAPSLGPVPLPPTPPAPKPLDPPPSPSLGPRGGPRGQPFETAMQPLQGQPKPLVYRPVHQASSGG